MVTELVVVGDIGVDVVAPVDHLPASDEKIWVDSLDPCPGGMAANVAVAYAALGGSAAVVGRVGRDDHARLTRDDLRRCGVDTDLVQECNEPTFWTLALATPGGDRCLIQFPTAALWPELTPEVIERVAAAPIVHTIAEQGDDVVTLVAATGPGSLTSCDIESPAVRRDDLAELVGHLDVAFVNRGAVDDLTGDPLTTAEELQAMGAGTVCVTLGGDGALVVGPGAGPLEVAPHAVEPVDSTGAGDAFAGAFLWARHRGVPDAVAAELANAVAAVSTTAPGRRAVGAMAQVGPLLADRGVDPVALGLPS